MEPQQLHFGNIFGFKFKDNPDKRPAHIKRNKSSQLPVPIEQPCQLEVDWEKIDEHFSTRFQIVYACTTTKIHLDVSDISVDGAKNKVGSIVIAMFLLYLS